MKSRTSPLHVVRETPFGPGEPIVVHPEWSERFPWVIQGTTTRGSTEAGFNTGAFTPEPFPVVHGRWRALMESLGCTRFVAARQTHESRILTHEASGPEGIVVVDGVDGHVSRDESILLTVTVADCVPIFIVDPPRRAVGMVHAGWRGVAAGILEAAVERMTERFDSRPGDLFLHFGPSACAERYEVGPEVHEALGLPPVDGPTPIDLRGALADRAVRVGVPVEQLTRSAYSTLDPDTPFYSHRRGDSARQIGFIALRGSRGPTD